MNTGVKSEDSGMHCTSTQFRERGDARIAARRLLLFMTVVIAATSVAPGQTDATQGGGFKIRAVSAYGAYYSSTLPNGGGISQGTATPLPSDLTGGGSIAFEWTRFTERNTVSVKYTPSYTGRLRFSAANSLNHLFSLATTRRSGRWDSQFSASGDYSSIEQTIFSQTAQSSVASVPSTFDELATGVLSARSSNLQLTNVLAGSPVVESPVRNLLYGARVFTSSARASLGYSFSPRFSITFSGGGGRTQNVSDGQGQGAANPYLIRATTQGTAGAGFSYALSPLTKLGGTVVTRRTWSSLQDIYTTTSMATFGRTFARRWILQLSGGVGVINPVRQSLHTISTKPQAAGGGSLGFKTRTQTFLGSFDRTVSDSYGAGAVSTSSVEGTWRWSIPGRHWWTESGIGWQSLQGDTIASTSGWRASAGLGQRLGRHFTVFTQYAYLSYSGLLQQSAYSVSQSAVRVSLVWWPSGNVGR